MFDLDLPTMTTHNLHNEGALMRIGSADNGINGLNDAMQGGIRANGHVSATEIIVNGANLFSKAL